MSGTADNNSENLKVNTTSPPLPSKAIPTDKECVPKMKESEISELVELFKSDTVHVVDIRLSFSGNGHHQQLLSELRVKLLNPIGREILFALEYSMFSYVNWTLNAGVRYFKLNVEESHNCVDRSKSAAEFAVKNMLSIVLSINLATNYEVWYYFKETSSGKMFYSCCLITNYNVLKCNAELSSKKNSFLCSVGFEAATCIMVTFCLLCVRPFYVAQDIFSWRYNISKSVWN